MPQEFWLTNPLKDSALVEVLNKWTERFRRCYSKIHGENIFLYIFITLKNKPKKKKINHTIQPGYSKIMEVEGSKFCILLGE